MKIENRKWAWKEIHKIKAVNQISYQGESEGLVWEYL
jgi:hypothetical protein